MSRHRVVAVARLELRALLASPLLWALVLFAAFATLAVDPVSMIPTGDSAVGGLRPFANSPHAIARIFSLTGLLFYPFLVSILAGSAILRDDEARVGDLLHSTRLTPGEFVAGKFGGVLLAAGVVLVLHTAIAVGWSEAGAYLGSPAARGPFRLASYVVPALAFLAPGAIFCAGLALAIAERTRSAMAVYVAPVLLVVSGLAGLAPRGSSRLDSVLGVLYSAFDLWGTRWLGETAFRSDRGIAFYNDTPLAFDAAFLWNRLFVLAVPVAAVFLAARHRGEALRGASGGRPSPPPSVPAPVAASFRPLGELRMTTRRPGLAASVWEIARAELVHQHRQPALALLAVLALLSVVEAASSSRGVFDSEVLLTAGGLATGLLELLTALGALLVLFVVVESLDRARRLRVADLLHATPVPPAAYLLGAQLAVYTVIAEILLGCTAVGLGLLAFRNDGPVEAWPFLLVWGLILGPTFVVWANAVAALQGLLRSRYLTYAAGLALLGGTVALRLSGTMTWVSNWPLLGALRWSDLGTFERDGEALFLNRATVLGAAVLLGAVSVRAFRRREPDPIATRDRRSTSAFAWEAFALAPFLLLAVLPATVLSARIRNGFQGTPETARARDYWRKNVATWSGVETATLRHVDAKIVLEPRERCMRVDGVFLLVNGTPAPLRRLAFTVGPAFEGVAWKIDGAAAALEDRSGLHVLPLREALPPGGEVRVGFGYTAVFPRGVTRNGGETSEFILPSGVVLHTLGPNFLPVPGFVEGIGVDRENASEPPDLPDDFWKGELKPVTGNPSAFTSRVEVVVPSEYTVNGVGEKTSERRENGRTTVVWESGHPVRYLALVAGRWEVKRRDGAAVFYHPAHERNVEVMLSTLAAARRRYSEWFLPYPWAELTVGEYADHATRAQSFPTNIPFSEGIGFLTRSGPGTPLPVVVTAHEAAHQWWGHLLVPGRGPGSDVLIEGMAHYATLLFLQAEHGEEARVAFARRLEKRYAERRRVDAELPLARLRADGSATDETATYDKGAWVLWMLQQQVGRKRMLASLKAFILRFQESRDHPALHDLIEAIRPAADSPEEFQAFVDQWFFDVVLPEFQVRDAVVWRTGATWSASATIENVGTGSVTVDVAARRGEGGPASEEAERAAGAIVAVQLAPGSPRRVTFTMPFRPDRIVVDPGFHLLQHHRAEAPLLPRGVHRFERIREALSVLPDQATSEVRPTR